jgi:hypothetical protein
VFNQASKKRQQDLLLIAFLGFNSIAQTKQNPLQGNSSKQMNGDL